VNRGAVENDEILRTRRDPALAEWPAARGRVSRSGGRSVRRRLPLPVVLVMMLVGGLCSLLALNTASAAQELELGALTEANANASDTEQQLLRDLATAQAPAALASAAAGLGLVPNPNPAFLKINPDGSVSVLGVPTPASAPPPLLPPPSTAPSAPVRSAKASATPSAKPPGSSAATPQPARAATPSATGAPSPAVTVTVTRINPAGPTATRTGPINPRPTGSAPRPAPSTTPTGGHG